MNEPSSKPSAYDLTDRTLGEFRLLRRLGRGGMAEVFLADQTSLSRHVAIKVLSPENAATMDDDVVLQRFRQEAKAAAGLSHPNIVQVFSIGEEDGLHYIAQEYVEGVNLAEYIKRNGPPEASVATHLLRQIASALKVAADAGIVHRDIKPENIMLTRNGDAKVADFGLAQLTQGSDKLNLTQAGTTMGTPLYMSPEQVNGKKLDHRSDIYSFGVTAYHMLAGRPPFHGETAMSVAVQHLKDEPASLSTSRADLPKGLCKTVHKMMAKAPEARHQDAQEILKELDDVAISLGSTSVKFSLNSQNDTSWVSRLLTSKRMSQIGRIGATMVAVSLVAAGIGYGLRPPPHDESSVVAFNKMATAREQYSFAMLANSRGMRGNESAWQAVIEYFPKSIDARRAISQLGKLYLDRDDLTEAREQWDELLEYGLANTDEDLIMKGRAGLAYIDTLEGLFDDASKRFDILNAEANRLMEGSIEYDLLEDALANYQLYLEERAGDAPQVEPGNGPPAT